MKEPFNSRAKLKTTTWGNHLGQLGLLALVLQTYSPPGTTTPWCTLIDRGKEIMEHQYNKAAG